MRGSAPGPASARGSRPAWVRAPAARALSTTPRPTEGLRQKLARTSYPLAPNEDMQPSQVTRLFRRLHAHGLIAKIPRSRRWRVSLAAPRTMSTAIKLREVAYPALFAATA